MHSFKSAILAIFHFWQNGTFEPLHGIQTNKYSELLILLSMKIDDTSFEDEDEWNWERYSRNNMIRLWNAL